jgi:hypothetical protein
MHNTWNDRKTGEERPAKPASGSINGIRISVSNLLKFNANFLLVHSSIMRFKDAHSLLLSNLKITSQRSAVCEHRYL